MAFSTPDGIAGETPGISVLAGAVSGVVLGLGAADSCARLKLAQTHTKNAVLAKSFFKNDPGLTHYFSAIPVAAVINSKLIQPGRPKVVSISG